jgi:hypothetical protein
VGRHRLHQQGHARLAETLLAGRRLIVRRTRLTGRQTPLWPDWRHHAFVTDRDGDMAFLDADHRGHAVQELAIRDLKEGAGLNHYPSGMFAANAAWLVLATLAHDLLRWTAHLGAIAHGRIVAKTIRRRFLDLPGRLTRTARIRTLHLPTRRPRLQPFLAALSRRRALPALCSRAAPNPLHPRFASAIRIRPWRSHDGRAGGPILMAHTVTSSPIGLDEDNNSVPTPTSLRHTLTERRDGGSRLRRRRT